MLNLRPAQPEFRDPAVRRRCSRRSTAKRIVSDAFGGRRRGGRRADPADARGCSTPTVKPPVAYDRERRPAALRTRAGQGRRALAPAGRDEPVRHRAAQPGPGDEPRPVRRGRSRSPRTGRRLRALDRRRPAARRPSSSRTSPQGRVRRRRSSTSRSASTRTSIRCSPRPRPQTGGSNVAGAPGRRARRAPRGRPRRRAPTRPGKTAYSALQERLARAVPPPDRLPRRGRRGPRHARRTRSRPVADAVGSILGRANMAPRRRPVARPNRSLRVHAEVAKLADALASGASARKGVWVQVPSSVPPLSSDPSTAANTCPGGGIGIRVRLRGV